MPLFYMTANFHTEKFVGVFFWLGFGGRWVMSLFLSHFVTFCHLCCACSLILTVGTHFQRTQLFLLLDYSLCMEASPVYVPQRSLSFYFSVLHFSSVWDNSVLIMSPTV